MDQPIDQSQKPASAQPGASQNSPPSHEGISYDTKTLITVICLVFIYPIGVILMWVWMRWKLWVKLLISLIIIIPLLGIVAAGALLVVNPKAQMEKAKCVQTCQPSSVDYQQCIASCSTPQMLELTPTMPSIQ